METIVFLSMATGGGIAATLLFMLLRRIVAQPQIDAPPVARPGWLTVVTWLIWAPLGARVSVMVLSALLVVIFAATRAALIHADVLAAALAAIDDSVAASGISQIIHAPKLSRSIALCYDDNPDE